MTPSDGLGPLIFDRRLLRRRRDRHASDIERYDFLLREVAERLSDRLKDVTRRFPLALDLGCHHGVLAEFLAGQNGIETLVQCDLSHVMARRAAAKARRIEGGAVPTLAADEEALPFAPARFDLVVSLFALHWVNDLPGTLLQIRQALAQDRLLLAAFPGGESLPELSAALIAAESEITGGASPRVSPFVELRDAGHLLQRAGFTLPVVDRDRIRLSYPNALELMREIRGMGESNALVERLPGLARRDVLLRAAEIYQDNFADREGRVPASLEILYLTAWSPGPEQPRALTPGSAQVSLTELLEPPDTDEGA